MLIQTHPNASLIVQEDFLLIKLKDHVYQLYNAHLAQLGTQALIDVYQNAQFQCLYFCRYLQTHVFLNV